MNLFIDTNILLSFFHFTSEDLEELNKLIVAITRKKINLFVTDQVITEFKRNRENKLNNALSDFKQKRINIRYPRFCKEYSEYDNMRQIEKEFNKYHSQMLDKIDRDIKSNSLKADQIIKYIFEKAIIIQADENIINKSQIRSRIGNPPGKKNSLGDAINWELLLEHLPEEEDIYLISDDTDFKSVIDENCIKEFLANEWEKTKSSKIHFYRRISSFFNEHYPEIKLASELEKDILIQNLVESMTFIDTHNTIAELKFYSEFSKEEVSRMCLAAITNEQIINILSDDDVNEFFEELIGKYSEFIDTRELAILKKLLPKAQDESKEEHIL